MPTIAVDKAALYKELGREYTTDEFDELCFEFGIELDEDTTNEPRPIVDGVQEPPQLKIEIPANRYDMLCFEGIALNLNVFLQRQHFPNFVTKPPAGGKLEQIIVKEETAKIRPYVTGAILRNLKFDKARYDSFISLQDKLHSNLARQRTLVAIGTHDLDKVKGPFTYEALVPKEIKFAPLNQTQEMDAAQMMDFYDKDKHLGRYLHIIRDSPVYPVIYDSTRTVCSMPPIINGDHSKITMDTTNVFIECTATDRTKLDIVINMMVTMFSGYCSAPFTVEPVEIVSPHNNQSRTTPNLKPRDTSAEVSYINSCCGLSLSPDDICSRLSRMCYSAVPSTKKDLLDVKVPVTRADVLHQCDIMEDVAISYGFNKLPRTFPAKSAAIAAPLPISKLIDITRQEAAMAGWSEVLPLILCSHDENFAWLNRVDDGNTAIRLQNPKAQEYQIVRTSLIPGLLKCIRENKSHSVPMKIFEASDVAFKDLSQERKSRNETHFAAAYYGKSSGFEMVHGLLDRVLKMLKFEMVSDERAKAEKKSIETLIGFRLEEVDDPTYFAGHAAKIIKIDEDRTEVAIGTFGILHPSVLKNFELPFPVSTLEINLEPFL